MNTPKTRGIGWTFAITAGALFMFALDRQVVGTALPAIRRDLGANLQALEWTVNAYTLSFAVLLLVGSALGDRFGRRRVLTVGIAIFTVASAACALAPTTGALIAARTVQGIGGALITPLSLTILTAATPPERRGRVLGTWAAVAIGAASFGPVVGGALTDALSWHWIFWLNVPVGIALIPLARRRLEETHGPRQPLDLVGIALSAVGLLALVWALIESGRTGWGDPPVDVATVAGVVVLTCFIVWERRARTAILPLHFFRSRAFAAAATASLLAYFSLFGAFFLVAQLLQIGIGATPLQAGAEMLALTGTSVLIAPVAGALCDRIGPRPLLAGSLTVEAGAAAWLAIVASPGVTFAAVAPGLVLAGLAGAGLFAPIQAALLAAVEPHEQGQASGVATVIREVAGILGLAVLAAVFAAHGSTRSPAEFLQGVRPALIVAAAVAACGVIAAVFQPTQAKGPTDDRYRDPTDPDIHPRSPLVSERPAQQLTPS